MGMLFFGALFSVSGIVETVMDEIRWAKKKQEYDMRRWNRKHRCIV